MLTDILSIRPQRNRHAIFISAGDRESFASLALERLSRDFDVLIFQYGSDVEARAKYLERADLVATGRGTKFSNLQDIFRTAPAAIERYSTIWVCDDDLEPEWGDLRLLPAICEDFHLKVVSPAHSRKGKISYDFMTPKIGTHLFRYVTYVEMGCPLFPTKDLTSFLNQYEPTQGGFGDDWWYLNVFNADKVKCAAIVDAVTMVNPHDAKKSGGYREVELLGKIADHRASWREARELHHLREWDRKNLGLIAAGDIPPGSPTAEIFRQDYKSRLSMLCSELNYQLRFYKVRKNIQKRFFKND